MTAPRPYTLIAELTYRCPLRCPYCSNPTDMTDMTDEMSELGSDDWARIFAEAEDLGVMQLHLTGGEPLARRDLETLVARARALDLYVNLITSGVPLARPRLEALRDAGLDAVQVSLQDTRAGASDRVAGYSSFAHKLEVARWVKELGLPLTLNIVLHRDNLARVDEAIALAERLCADRLELANTQYLGWALVNREALLPSREAIDAARAVAAAARARLEGTMEVLFVLPDLHADRPRACMDGWGRRFVHVTPDGSVLPCHAARSIPGLRFERARDASLRSIWEASAAMNAFRGDAWMPEPCRSCPEKGRDFGGCRCQAFAFAHNAAATDPACALSPHHDVVLRAREVARDAARPRRYLFRNAKLGGMA
jgi:pyrroloquinoline quinone biosynthesis protein E